MRKSLILSLLTLFLLANVSVVGQWGPRPKPPKIRRVVSNNLHIKPGAYFTWNLIVDNRKGAWLHGSFSASSAVEFYVLTPDEYERWRNDESYSYVFATGRVRGFVFDPPLGLSSGEYRLVMSNKFSFLTSKDVGIVLDLEGPQ